MALHLADQFVQEKANEKATNELVSTLQIMGYEKEYVLRAIQVHQKSKFGNNWNLSLLVEIIMRLKEKENILNIFVPHFMTMSEPLRLKINDTVDYRFENGRFILCRIVEKKLQFNKHIIKLHPLGRPISDTKYDKYCNINDEYTKLAIAKSISLRRLKSKQHIFANLKIDDYIDINPVYRVGHEGWKSGRIIKLDPNSSQIKVLYHNEKDKKNYSYWVHLQNASEVASFRGKCKVLDQHQLQAEFENLEEEFTRLQRQSIVDMSNINIHKRPHMISPHSHSHSHYNTNSQSMSSTMSSTMSFKYPISMHPIQNNNNKIFNEGIDMKPPNQLAKQSQAKAIPQIKDDFNNQISSVALGNDMLMNDIIGEMDGGMEETPMGDDMFDTQNEQNINNYNPLIDDDKSPKQYQKSLKPIPKVKNSYQNKLNGYKNGYDLHHKNGNEKQSDFNNNISSVALGNEFLMDDIIGEMDGGMNETPMGDDMVNDMVDTQIINNNNNLSHIKAIPLVSSNSEEIEYGSVKANDCKEQAKHTMIKIMQDLQQFGYNKSDIIKAMNNISDRTNINAIIDYINNDSVVTTNVSFKVRNKSYDPNKLHKNKHNIDVDSIAFDDDQKNNDSESGNENIQNVQNTPVGNIDTVTDDVSIIDVEPQNINHYIDTVTDDEKKNNIEVINNIEEKKYKFKAHDNSNNECDEDDDCSPFIACMSMDEIKNLKELDRIDHRNIFGKFCRATVIGKSDEENKLQIFYNGWTHQYLMDGIWDGWCEINNNTQHRFATAHSISYRQSHQWKFKFLRVGSLVELRPITQIYHELNTSDGYYGWQCAEIFKIDNISGQIQCKYGYNNHTYLYWVHLDNDNEITYIDNMYEIGDNICVYNNNKKKWMIAKIGDIEMNCITIYYIEDNTNEKIHVCFDAKKLIFPKLEQDMKYIENAIVAEKLKWKLIKVTPTNNTIYQCFAYMIYGDLNQAINVKNECIRYIRYNKNTLEELNKNNNNNNNNSNLGAELNIMALCIIYNVRIRIFKYNITLKRLDIVFDRGVYDLNVPIILLSKHLNKYYNIIIDKQSLDQIPFYYH